MNLNNPCYTGNNYANKYMKKLICTLLCCFTFSFLSYGQDKGYLYGLTQGESSRIIQYDITAHTLYQAHVLPEKPIQGYNNLIQASDGKLYGMTESGGTKDNGVIFSFDPIEFEYTILKNFGDIIQDGKSPDGSLIQASDGKLYGMTESGGTKDNGIIFSFDPIALTYTILKNFGDIQKDGRSPYGSLMQALDGKLYGMTESGGANDYGTIFSFDPESTNKPYAKLKDFTGSDGKSPYGNLIQAKNGKLYGLTQFGGTNGYGVVFAFDPFTKPANPTYQKWDFNVPNVDNFPDGDNVVNGAWPNGSLTEAFDGVKYQLYGMTESGGKNYGVIFSFDPAAPEITKLMDFDKQNGRSPYGSLTLASDAKLYGMTHRGGMYDDGVIFSYDPSMKVEPNEKYTVLANFDGKNGALPYASLTEVRLKNPNEVQPVDIISFMTKAVKSKIQLNWQVANELDIQKYEVERSADGLQFTAIGSVTAKNAVSPFPYSFIDQQPLANNNYYRLKIHERYAEPHYSAIKSATNLVRAFKISLMPNPVISSANLELEIGGESTVQLKLQDLQGRTVKQWPDKVVRGGIQVFSLPMDEVAAGSYLLVAESPIGKQVLRLIKVNE